MTYNETQKFIISHELECKIDIAESKEIFQVAKETNQHAFDNLASRINGKIDVDDLGELSAMGQHAAILEILSMAIWNSVNEFIIETLEEIEVINELNYDLMQDNHCDNAQRSRDLGC